MVFALVLLAFFLLPQIRLYFSLIQFFLLRLVLRLPVPLMAPRLLLGLKLVLYPGIGKLLFAGFLTFLALFESQSALAALFSAL